MKISKDRKNIQELPEVEAIITDRQHKKVFSPELTKKGKKSARLNITKSISSHQGKNKPLSSQVHSRA